MIRCLGVLAFVFLAAGPLRAQDALEKQFKAALQAGNAADLERVCRSIVLLGRPEGAKLILGALAKPHAQDLYWLLVRAAASFQTSDALALVAKHAVDKKKDAVARDLTMALHNNFTAGAEAAMCAILVGGNDELRLCALDHLMDFGGKPAVAAAIEALGKKDAGAEVKSRCARLLKKLTKQDYGDSVGNWSGWWEANKDKPWEEIRKGHGGSTTALGSSRQDEYDRLKEAKVLVIHAADGCDCGNSHNLDHGIDNVMRRMPFEVEWITKAKFENDPSVDDAWLSKFIAVIVICTQTRQHCACPDCKPGGDANMRLYRCTGCNKHKVVRYMLGRKGTSRIKRFVDNGGYLFTEDWAIEEVIEPEWGDCISRATYLREQEVPVLPNPGQGTHPYLRKIFVKPPTERHTSNSTSALEEDVSRLEHLWKIDADSPAIAVKDKKRVTVLMVSETIRAQSEKDSGSDALAVTFGSGAGGPEPVATGRSSSRDTQASPKGGRVLHVLAHFGKQSTTSGGQKGEASLLNLLVNFLIEANERRGGRIGK